MYAFIKENFKRSKEEVALLMNMKQEKLEVLIDKESMVTVTKYGIQVQILGELSSSRRVRRETEEVMVVSVYKTMLDQ